VSEIDVEAILGSAVLCRLATVSNGAPHISLLPFGREGNTLFLHGSRKAPWIQALADNPRVFVEFDLGGAKPLQSDQACHWDIAYEAVIGAGTARLLSDPDEKQHALEAIMRTYSSDAFEYPAGEVESTAVVRVDVEGLAGKHS
jgi:nitroimidazol reductase NimA-like FMN-containing flavoprotein (pyridoxamine 5'-phosphate oxidase superfamily)